jgi:hypothetical protein
MFFTYDHLVLRYEPFPIGLAKPLMEPGLYQELLANYPPLEKFAYHPKVGHKYTLSEKSNPGQYHDIVRNAPIWRRFHRWIKSDAFVVGVMDALRERSVDLGYAGRMPTKTRLRKFGRNLRRGRLDWGPNDLRARFEFSMLPADGGSVIPHSDSLEKVVTLVVSMAMEGEWKSTYGGGTDVNRHKDPTRSFNLLNRRAEFDEMEIIDSYPFEPNQAVIFVKTYNSWHSVRPMQGAGSKAMRRTLTINIEEDR